MRILMVSTYYPPYCSGMTEYVRRLSEELANRGHKVTVLTSRHDNSLKTTEIINRVTVIRSPVLLKFDKGVVMPFFVITALLKSRSYDVVNLHLPMMESGLLALFVPKSKLVCTYHCDLLLRNSPVSKALEKLYYFSAKIALSRCKLAVVYTEDYAHNSVLLKQFLAKCKAIYPPIDQQDFVHRHSSLKKKVGIRGKVVGFAGRFVEEKGLLYLLQAIPYVLKKYPNTTFVLAGEHERVAGGSVMSKLKPLVEKYQKNVVLLGNVAYAKLSEFYSACDVLVLPSVNRLEAFGMVQVEAMLCGAPVVAANLPGVRVPVKVTGMGLLVRPKDPQALAEAVCKVLRNKARYTKPRSNIEKEFNIQSTVDEYEKLIS